MNIKNRNCAFTIVAKNYIGLAMILEQSIKRYNSTTDFFIVVADEFDQERPEILPSNVIVAKDVLDINHDLWNEMAFKYNLTEFCTSIKPKSLSYFIKNGYDKVMYLDPDTFFFSDIDQIFSMLDSHLIVLSPHLVHLPPKESNDIFESTFLNYGVYNLGFVAVRNDRTISRILDWWHERLAKYCFIDSQNGLFTDQLWMNFVPGFLSQGQCLISRHQGLDVAPWNYQERRIIDKGGAFHVVNRNLTEGTGDSDSEPLVFCHFSGYDYKGLTSGTVRQKTQPNLEDYDDIRPVMEHYRDEFMRNRELFRAYLQLKYTYATFDDSTPISNLARRMFRTCVDTGDHMENPFSSSGTYYIKLRKKGLLPKSGSGKTADQLRKNDLGDVGRLESMIASSFRILRRLVGTKRYVLFLRYLQTFSRYESQKFLIE